MKLVLDPLSCTVRAEGSLAETRLFWTQGCFGRGDGDDRRRTVSLSEATELTEETERVFGLVEAAYVLAAEGDRLLPSRTLCQEQTVDGERFAVASLRELLKRIKALGCTTFGVTKFATRLTAYSLLRQKGWVVRDGVRFASDYVLYKPGGPEQYHADYSVILIFPDSPTSWRSVIASSRFTDQVKKKLVRMTVEIHDSKLAPDLESALKSIAVHHGQESPAHLIQIKRWIP
ncbi:tRNA intron endonuclease [Chytriomyces sp. MP71]|nr:tRNA intron endonuclease [Chytriomyces sp. MP71]